MECFCCLTAGQECSSSEFIEIWNFLKALFRKTTSTQQFHSNNLLKWHLNYEFFLNDKKHFYPREINSRGVIFWTICFNIFGWAGCDSCRVCPALRIRIKNNFQLRINRRFESIVRIFIRFFVVKIVSGSEFFGPMLNPVRTEILSTLLA